MRPVGQPGAWSEDEQRAFLGAPTVEEGAAALAALRERFRADHDDLVEGPPLGPVAFGVLAVLLSLALAAGGLTLVLLGRAALRWLLR